MKLYFLVEVETWPEDHTLDPDLPPGYWDGVPYENEQAYIAQVNHGIVNDLSELGVQYPTKVTTLQASEIKPDVLAMLGDKPDV